MGAQKCHHKKNTFKERKTLAKKRGFGKVWIRINRIHLRHGSCNRAYMLSLAPKFCLFGADTSHSFWRSLWPVLGCCEQATIEQSCNYTCWTRFFRATSFGVCHAYP